jgi:hypothetical protein
VRLIDLEADRTIWVEEAKSQIGRRRIEFFYLKKVRRSVELQAEIWGCTLSFYRRFVLPIRVPLPLRYSSNSASEAVLGFPRLGESAIIRKRDERVLTILIVAALLLRYLRYSSQPG